MAELASPAPKATVPQGLSWGEAAGLHESDSQCHATGRPERKHRIPRILTWNRAKVTSRAASAGAGLEVLFAQPTTRASPEASEPVEP
jgi:hypothetical protein